MTETQTPWLWLDARDSVTLADLARACGMSAAELDELVDYGALVPLAPAQPERLFSAEWVPALRSAAKLRLDLELDLFTMALVLDYLGRIAALEQQIQTLRAQLPRIGPGA